MVEARDRDAARAQADDWLERGWNPFKGQESPNRQWHESNPTGIARMRDESGLWTRWMWDQRDKLRVLAESTFKRTASGKLDMGDLVARAAQDCWRLDSESHQGLDLFLFCGGDPEAPGRARLRAGAGSSEGQSQPPLFEASRAGAEKLIKAGANPTAKMKDKQGKTCWEAWALRAAKGQLGLDDLDWMATRCPPSPGISVGLPVMATRARAFGVLDRLAPMGMTPKDFRLEGEDLARALSDLMAQGDLPETLESYAKITGWPAILEVMGARVAFEPVNADKLRLNVEASPLAVALASGRVKCLGVLEREGLLGSKKGEGLAVLCASAWRQAMTLRGGGVYGNDAPKSAGLVWALGRLGKSGGTEALKALEIAASCDLQQMPRVIESCASKGWLPDSGVLSASGIFNHGSRWREPDTGRSFQQFMAVVEAKSLRSLPVAQKAVPTARTRIRL